MILPFMFLTGMCLIDTLNGLFMAWLYGKSSSTMQRLQLGVRTEDRGLIVGCWTGAVSQQEKDMVLNLERRTHARDRIE